MLLGVKMPLQRSVNHPFQTSMFLYQMLRSDHIWYFIEKAYGARGTTNDSTMRVLLDCSWMLMDVNPLTVRYVVNYLVALHSYAFPGPEHLFVMLDFGSLGFGRNDEINTDIFTQDIATSIQSYTRAAEWYRWNVKILWPNQAVYLKKNALNKKQSGPSTDDEEEQTRQMFLYQDTNRPAFWPYSSWRDVHRL